MLKNARIFGKKNNNMIQRKQSIFLLLVIASSILLFIFPLVTYTFGETSISYPLSPFDVPLDTSPMIYGLFVVNCILFITSFMCLMLFHNRKKQIKVSRIIIGVLVLLIVGIFFLPLHKSETAIKSYNWAIALPIISIVFIVLATHFIKKDEKLVQSADRIR